METTAEQVANAIRARAAVDKTPQIVLEQQLALGSKCDVAMHEVIALQKNHAGQFEKKEILESFAKTLCVSNLEELKEIYQQHLKKIIGILIEYKNTSEMLGKLFSLVSKQTLEDLEQHEEYKQQLEEIRQSTAYQEAQANAASNSVATISSDNASAAVSDVADKAGASAAASDVADKAGASAAASDAADKAGASAAASDVADKAGASAAASDAADKAGASAAASDVADKAGASAAASDAADKAGASAAASDAANVAEQELALALKCIGVVHEFIELQKAQGRRFNKPRIIVPFVTTLCDKKLADLKKTYQQYLRMVIEPFKKTRNTSVTLKKFFSLLSKQTITDLEQHQEYGKQLKEVKESRAYQEAFPPQADTTSIPVAPVAATSSDNASAAAAATEPSATPIFSFKPPANLAEKFQQDLVQQEEELANLQNAIQQKEQEIATLQEYLQQRVRELAILQEQHTKLVEDIKIKKQQLPEVERRTAKTLEQELRQQSAAIEQKLLEEARKQAEAHGLEFSLPEASSLDDEKDENTAAAGTEPSATPIFTFKPSIGLAEKVRQDLAQQEEELANSQNAIQQKEQEIATLQESLQQQEPEPATLREQHTKLAEEIRAKKQQLPEVERRSKELLQRTFQQQLKLAQQQLRQAVRQQELKLAATPLGDKKERPTDSARPGV